MLSVDMELTDEVVSVIGMSGSGKSMTLKCIAGIVVHLHVEPKHEIIQLFFYFLL